MMASSIRVTRVPNAARAATRPTWKLVNWFTRSTNCCRTSDRAEEKTKRSMGSHFTPSWQLLVLCANIYKLSEDSFSFTVMLVLYILPNILLFCSALRDLEKVKHCTEVVTEMT